MIDFCNQDMWEIPTVVSIKTKIIDKFFPSLGFCFSGDFQTNKQVIWPSGGDSGSVAWATSWWIGKNQNGDWDPTSWAILDDSLTPPVVYPMPTDFCASQRLYICSQPQKGPGG